MVRSQQISELTASFTSVSLNEMDRVRFMDRIDTKYLFAVNLLPVLLKRLNGDYFILQTSGIRIPSYKTLYFDTPDYLFFNQHVRNIPIRSKLRYRLYETTGDSFLEVKKKNARNRTKKWRIEHQYSTGNNFDKNATVFITDHIKINPDILIAVISNSFNRMTFIGRNFNERVTIDFNIRFSDALGAYVSLPFLGIAEVKRDVSGGDSKITGILRDLTARSTGFSKYCVGSVLLQPRDHANIIKPKVLLIKKIQNEFNKYDVS